jgi:hypothetical protein
MEIGGRLWIDLFRIADHPLVTRAADDQHLDVEIIADVLPHSFSDIVCGGGMLIRSIVGM